MKVSRFQSGGLAAVLFLVCLVTGCTHVIKLPPTPYAGYKPREKITATLALNLTDELRNTKWEDHSAIGGDVFIIPIGQSIAQNAPVLANQVFSAVHVVTNGAPALVPVDAVLTPKVPYINRTTGSTSFSESVIAIKVEWTLSDLSGQTIWADTVAGQGTGSTGWSKPEEVLKRAWEDVLKKSYHTLWYSRGIREFLQKKHPDVQVVEASARIVNPEVKRLCDQLESSNGDAVMSALKTLRKMDAPEAVPEVVNCLEHSDPYVIRDACRTLAVLGTRQNIPAIEPLLNDKRKDVRKDANLAIETLRKKP